MITKGNNKNRLENTSKGSSPYIIAEDGTLQHCNLIAEIAGVCPYDDDIKINLPYELTLTFYVEQE